MCSRLLFWAWLNSDGDTRFFGEVLKDATPRELRVEGCC